MKDEFKSYLRFCLASILVAFLLLNVTNLIAQESGKEKPVAAISLTKMNVLYVGIDNPAVIAVPGYKNSEVDVSISLGKIKKLDKNGRYIINPMRPGTATITVNAGGKVIQETEFRVKALPDPVAKVGMKKGGMIMKNVLLSQKGVIADMENFDFDLKFSVVGFVVSTTDGKGLVISAKSESNEFTDDQKEILKNLGKNQRINFEEIKAIGPDGSIRKLAPIVFEIE